MAINDMGPPHQITQIDRSGNNSALSLTTTQKKLFEKITRHTFTKKCFLFIRQHGGNIFQEIVNLH